MSTFKGFRAVAHLLEQLGDERFAALIDSKNTGRVKELCDALVKGGLPTEMTIEGRTYDILCFLREGETSLVDHELVTRTKEMSDHLGQDDGEHILRYQYQIPASLRGKVVFFFTDWHHPARSEDVACVGWGGGSHQWVRHWHHLSNHWRDDRVRVLRRRK